MQAKVKYLASPLFNIIFFKSMGHSFLLQNVTVKLNCMLNRNTK